MKKTAELPIDPRLSMSILLVLIFACVVRAQSQQGFISLDCGFAGSASYVDNFTKLSYVGDAKYTDAGETHSVSQNPLNPRYSTLRSFPQGARNCYELSPVQPGNKYLVRAGFFYGNYDGQGSPPSFDLRLGVDFWTTVGSGSDGAFVSDVITVAQKNNIQVCLVNTKGGTPFISSLELRPLLDSMYPAANASQSLAMNQRMNYGTSDQLRYPDDPYDRSWDGVADGFLLLNTTRAVEAEANDAFQVPSKVFQTAITYPLTNYHLSTRAVTGNPGERIYIVMHFAELVKLNPANESRHLNIFGVDGGVLLFANYSPPYLKQDHKEILNAVLGAAGSYNTSIYVTNSSTHSYMINALESFLVRPMNESQTDDRDVSAVEEIKRAFGVKRNWQADPCSPRAYTWEGLGCSYEDHPTARIISLNLSRRGLQGVIPSAIGSLTALRNLDLSGNNLTGPIPENFGELSSLQFINLSGNEALGSIPQDLCNKISEGSLSTSGEVLQCKNSGAGHKKIILAVVIPASIIILIVASMWIIQWKRKARSSKGASNSKNKIARAVKEVDARKGVMQFTYSEITQITQNFQHEIGKGGFGSVYLGNLNEETKVAVKVISSLSSQGSREFQAEVLLLERVHHKNLVQLLGYCDEENHLSLVYEYMDNGNLRDHLSGRIGDGNLLNWNRRVSIALQAAQGLDYLHNGCRPPIVHRDIKTNNILLNSEFVTKIADFGLSRAFSHDNATHITTGLAGTPGYLDPEYYENDDRLNEKSDVYSFGIVLFEIITGQPPYQKSAEKTHIVRWVQSRVESGDMNSIVDARLKGDFDVNTAWKLVEVAMSCTTKNSEERMTMGNVVIQLKQCLDMNESDITFEETRSASKISSGVYPFREIMPLVPSTR